jgi:hypothetical protein
MTDEARKRAKAILDEQQRRSARPVQSLQSHDFHYSAPIRDPVTGQYFSFKPEKKR